MQRYLTITNSKPLIRQCLKLIIISAVAIRHALTIWIFTGRIFFIDRTKGSIKINAVIDFGNAMFGIPFTDEYRLKTYKFFKEDAYNCNTQKKYYFTGDELFAIEILFDLECLVFGGMMKYNWGKKAKVILKCEEYLA